jgi:hypothetical protein
MKYFSALLLLFICSHPTFSQNPFPNHFLDGKAVVLISNAPQARPSMDWKTLAEKLHPALLSAGGDPVSYFELEDVILSEESQASYAETFSKRLIKSVIIVTRPAKGDLYLNIAPFTGNKNIVPNTGVWSIGGDSLENVQEKLEALGKNHTSKNLLVLEVPEFPDEVGNLLTTNKFIAKNPLNLEVFKLGVPLSGSSGESGFLSAYRYDLIGKSQEIILAEQNAEQAGMEGIFSQYYPHQVEYLRSSKTEADLIADRVQFVLMRVEAREGDLMKNMGLAVENPEEKNRIVVKYYIKFLVRDELYIGPVWDADPDWRAALTQFLKNLN